MVGLEEVDGFHHGGVAVPGAVVVVVVKMNIKCKMCLAVSDFGRRIRTGERRRRNEITNATI